MSEGQARVLLLIIVLGFLEAAANPTIRQWWKNAYSAIGTGVQPQKS